MNNTLTFYEKTIVDNIDFDGYGLDNDVNLYDKIKTLYNIFKLEYGWNIERMGEKTAFAEWLSGLPSALTVPFYYYEMLENAKNYGMEIKDEDKFCEEYFMKLSEAFFTLKENL
jgi:hypothetical protein